VVPALIAPGINLRSPEFLPFLAVLRLGTATALLLYFWRDWWELFLGIFQGWEDAQGENRRRLLLLFVAGTVPAGVIGFLFEKPLRALFAEPKAAAAFLAADGFLQPPSRRARRDSARR
jgi:undecaprenyl-diphosphatase